METPSDRLAAALLTQTPGSGATRDEAGVLHVVLPLDRFCVVRLVDAGLDLEGAVRSALAGGRPGQPFHLVAVGGDAALSARALEALLPEDTLRALPVGGWTWSPEAGLVHVCGKRLPQLEAAARLAASDGAPTLAQAHQAAAQEATRSDGFQAVLEARRPVVTWAIAALCVALFGLQLLWGQGEPTLAARRMGADVPRLVLQGEWWRLFTAMLLHAGVLHLAMNMFALFGFGVFLEQVVGRSRYLLLFVLSGLGGSLLSLTRGGDGSGVGASGGVWGLMVAGAVLVTWPRGLLPDSWAHRMRRRAWSPVVLNAIISFQPGIDLRAHLGGGLAGAALLWLMNRGGTGLGPLRPDRRLRAAAAAVGLLLLASVGLALAHGRPWAIDAPWTLRPAELSAAGLSLLVPSELAPVPREGRWQWGDLAADGAEVELAVAPQPAPAGAATLDAILPDLGKPPPGARYAVAPLRVALPSGRPAIFAELAPTGGGRLVVWVWWTVQDRWLVRVEGTLLGSPSPARKAELARVADSLAPAR